MKPTILLVEDNVDILDFIEDNLISEYNIKKALNGKASLDILRNEVVDLIVTDVMMPIMNGFELCSIIKTDLELSHLPVIILTAKHTLQSKLQGLELGADVYIEKPFSPKYLKMQIGSLLENRNKIKMHFHQSPLAHLKTVAHTKSDEKFLLRVNEIILQHLKEEDFNVDQLAKVLNMSRSTLYRKINAVSNLSTNELINITRLKRGAELLLMGYNINETSAEVGYSSPKIFSKNFEKQFCVKPSQYIHSKEI